MTTETNEERLEFIRQHKAFFTGFGKGVDTSVILSVEDYKWLIQQAERVSELEDSAKGLALAVEVYSDMPVKEAMEKLVKIVEEEHDENTRRTRINHHQPDTTSHGD